MKKTINILIVTLFLLMNLSSITYAKSKSKVPSPGADSTVLMDADSGEILYSKNPHKAYPPASTTKIMTTLLTLERGNLNDMIKVGQKPPYADGSSISLRVGEKAKVEDVLYGLNLQSGNDCAEALAEYISGTQKKFVQLMNERAKELGCTDSHFENPSGLYNKNHEASANDLALILKELVKHPEYFEITKTLTHKMPKDNKCKVTRYIWNKNEMVRKGTLGYYKYAVAGKTGYTIQSEHSYVAVAKKGGRTLIVTLVHSKINTCYQDTKNLFEYGFNNFSTKSLFKKEQNLSDITLEKNDKLPVVAGKDFYYTSKKGDKKVPTYTLQYDKSSLAKQNIKLGDKVGSIIVAEGSKKTTIPLLSGSAHKAVKKAALPNKVSKNIFSHKDLFIFSAAVIVLFLLTIFFKSRISRNRKKYKGYRNFSDFT